MDFKKSNKTPQETFSIISKMNEDVLKPIFKEDRGSWVKYGEKNNFPNELLTLYNKSRIHNAIIETKTRMMLGEGVVQDVENEEELSDKTQTFIDHPNPFETLDEIYGKLSLDYEIHGLAYIEVLWGKGYKEIAEIHHVDATKIRWGKYNDKGRIDTFYYSQDFDNIRKYPATPIPIFDDTKKEARQILPIVRYSPGFDYYTLPDYYGGVKWIDIDTQIANFHYNNLKNGMQPSIFFGFPVGDKTEEERENISKSLKEKYRGTDNTSEMLLAFYDAEGDAKPVIEILEMSNADKQFDLLNKTSLQQILIAHKVTNENLVGISTPGKLGGSNELLEAYDIYYNTIIKHEQNKILTPLNRIFLINGLNPIKIINNKPFEYNLSENVLKEILDVNELRDLIGYDIVEEDEEVQNEVMKEEFAVRTINGSNYASKIPDAELEDIYVWRAETEPCPVCKERNGISRTLSSWLNIGVPAVPTGTSFTMKDGSTVSANFAHSPYGSFCEADCKCKLVKIGSAKK